MGDAHDLTPIVGALVRYLRANPHACDTAEGIHRWWFPPDVRFTPDAVGRALDWMKRQHLLEVTTAADGHQRFRRSATDEALTAALRSMASGQSMPGDTR
jgi:Fe2+ or Zn2+ uptake regulation protein